ncbi:MAG TPA: aminotransferase class I/II-fold pyridoxal phosphate-dependent enzyme [Polyangiaceae bacterium]|nr:aminotransferase class I/II-fold pyridoxal phosphate-dependent enzyme [Polyangiaceae bacterium]
MSENSHDNDEVEFPSDGRTPVSWMSDLQRRRRAGPRHRAQIVARDTWRSATVAVQSGTYQDPTTGAVGSPIFASTTFRLTPQSYQAFSQGVTRDLPIYTRYGNPSQWAVQEKIAALEQAESTVVFSSGMAAIATTLITLTNHGGHIVSSFDIYGGTYNLFREDMYQFGRSVSFVDGTDVEQVRAAIRDNTQVIYLETLTNPLLKVPDLPAVVKLAREREILVVVDNTFLSPALLKPHALGVDVVVHSCTKYMNGHSDLTAGSASGSRKYVDRIWAQLLRFGGSLDPMGCFLLERGLKTLPLRMNAHSANAAALARYLSGHPKVRRVYHPTLSGDGAGWLGEATGGRFGGMVSFEVEGGDAQAQKLLDLLELPLVATSLGGVESLISAPFNTTHSSLTEPQRRAVGINPGLVRLSAGIEDIDDLVADLESGLARLG